MTKKEDIPGYRISEELDSIDKWTIKNLSPYVRQSGNQWRPRWKIRSRKLLDYLLVFIASGDGCFSVDNESFAVKQGYLIWIPPNTLHTMRGNSEKMHCIYLHFDLIFDPERSYWDACIPADTEDLSPVNELMHPVIDHEFWRNMKGKIDLRNSNAVKALMIKICSLHDNCKSDNALRISGIMLELLSEIKDQIIAKERKGILNYERLTAAAKYISDHPEQNVSIKKLARKSGLSESHFRRLFIRINGISPKSMHLQVRIRKACELLTYWNMNVSETAEYLNFPSIHAFSRTFKNIQGVSPKEYLKRIL